MYIGSHGWACFCWTLNSIAYLALSLPHPSPNFDQLKPHSTPADKAKVEKHIKHGSLGQVAGIAVDQDGRVFAFHRNSQVWSFDSFDAENNFNTKKYNKIKDPTISVIHPSGVIESRRGADRFYMPHGLSLSRDHIWVTDVALHQVFKIPKDIEAGDEPVLTLGTAFKNGNDNLHFCKPTDVAVSTDGTIFVADGYCNNRIVVFSPEGKWQSEWGEAVDGSSYPPYAPGQFDIPHGLALIEDWDLLCVADRENERIQCFSAGLGRRGSVAGSFVKKAEGLGRVYAIDHKDHFLAGVTGTNSDGSGPKMFVVDLNSGESKIYDKGLRVPHDVAIAGDDTGIDTVYVADISNRPGIERYEL